MKIVSLNSTELSSYFSAVLAKQYKLHISVVTETKPTNQPRLKKGKKVFSSELLILGFNRNFPVG